MTLPRTGTSHNDGSDVDSDICDLCGVWWDICPHRACDDCGRPTDGDVCADCCEEEAS